jgi:hypothetical protein
LYSQTSDAVKDKQPHIAINVSLHLFLFVKDPPSEYVFPNNAESFKWQKFLGEVADAVQDKQPTLFLAEHVNSLTTTYPDLFYALPQLRPSEPLVGDLWFEV